MPASKAERALFMREYRKRTPPDKRTQYMREYRARNPDATRTHWRKSKLKTKYGITLEQYDVLFHAQGGVCAICRRAETAKNFQSGTVQLLSVDHCHATGRVRGLLCSDCNLAMGMLRDDVSALARAIEYLSK